MCIRDRSYPVLAALPHDFRVLQRQFINARHDDPIAGSLDLIQCRFDLVIGALGPCQTDDTGQQLSLIHIFVL